MNSASRSRDRLAALALVLAGVLFVLYPAIRPFSDETTLEGARAFASNAWLVAHSLAMAGFILLILAWLGVYGRLLGDGGGLLALTALITAIVGVGLTLPYYGAETFALHALGEESLRKWNPDVFQTLTNSIRLGEGIWFLGLGLAGVGIGAILFAIAIWRSATVLQWTGIPLALALSLFIPQFFAAQPVRVGHGMLVLIGCLAVAWGMLQVDRRQTVPSGRAVQAG